MFLGAIQIHRPDGNDGEKYPQCDGHEKFAGGLRAQHLAHQHLPHERSEGNK